jgi:hypothetical protein
MVAQLTPQSITGATFQISCALSEMDLMVRGGDAPQIRLASEKRVQALLAYEAMIYRRLGNLRSSPARGISDETTSDPNFMTAKGDQTNWAAVRTADLFQCNGRMGRSDILLTEPPAGRWRRCRRSDGTSVPSGRTNLD